MSVVSQKRFLRGLNASADTYSQPSGIVSRISNMIFNIRGAVKTCDGSLILARLNNVIQSAGAIWTEIFLYQPVGQNRYYLGICKDTSVKLGAPVGQAVALGAGGGTLPAATYYYKITATDGAGGETTPSGEVNVVNAGAIKNSVTWTAKVNATGYNVYRGTAPGAEVFLTSVSTNAFLDDGSITIGTATPPLNDTTQQCLFYKIETPNYTAADILHTFPADSVPAPGSGGSYPDWRANYGFSDGQYIYPLSGNAGTFIYQAIVTPLDGDPEPGVRHPPVPKSGSVEPVWDQTSGATFDDGDIEWTNTGINGSSSGAGGGGGAGGGIGSGGGTPGAGGSGSGTGSGSSPSGGVSGNISSLPLMMQFVNKVILLLGNGYPIYVFDGTTTTAVTNTFNALYPDWQTATTYAAGDVIKDSVSGYLFRATQGGTTAAGRPAFPATLNATVADNQIIWMNVGLYTGTPAPRGAAHGIIYAGSLWVANTNPIATADQLDGPSALRMSDINNPNSWNPLNAANLSKDDGTQITGMTTFTISEQGIAPTGSLIVFKEFSTFQIVGVFGSTNFSIQQAKTDLGCIAPRSIQFLPGYGIARLTHLGIAVFNGVGDQVISEEIRPYLFDNVDDDILSMDWNFAYFAKAAQSAVPPMYVLAIPVALPNLGTVITSLAASAVNSLPTGAYYTRVYGIDADGNESSISVESGPVNVTNGAAFSLKVVGPTMPSNIVKWRIYFGIGAGMENQFIETTADLTAGLTITAPGTSGSPSRGVGGLTRICCYDLVLKCWAIIDLPYAISVLRQFRYTGAIPVTVVGGFKDGTVRRIQAGDADWDGTAISWSFRTPEVFGEGGTQRVHYRKIMIKGVAEDPTTITLTPQYNGSADDVVIPRNYIQGSNQFRADVELHTDAESANATISGTGTVEIDSVDWDVDPKPVGTPPIFS